jgi:hypothetical protein
LANAEAGPLRERFHREIGAQIRWDPGGEIGKAIGCFYLKAQRLGVLLLPPGSLEVHDHFAGYGEGRLWAEILLDHCQRQIDPGSDPRRCIEAVVLVEERVRIDAQFRESTLHVVDEGPMGGDLAPVEESRRG